MVCEAKEEGVAVIVLEKLKGIRGENELPQADERPAATGGASGDCRAWLSIRRSRMG
ncbi:MAG: hypothetical protein KIH10_02090 [Candidatus Freyarchaeota archaeon]|nr:hypothetical protein [Candidatus Jordarchaeia archaeon]